MRPSAKRPSQASTASFLDALLQRMLRRHFAPATAKLYSWHSARIFLACSLLASNASRAQIQALCRWQTEESLNIYALIGEEQYSRLIVQAMATNIDAGRASTLADAVPFIDRSDLDRAHAQAAPTLRPQLDEEPDPDDDADLE